MTNTITATGAPACRWCNAPLPEGRPKFCSGRCVQRASNNRRDTKEGRSPRLKPKAQPSPEPGILPNGDCRYRDAWIDEVLARRRG